MLLPQSYISSCVRLIWFLHLWKLKVETDIMCKFSWTHQLFHKRSKLMVIASVIIKFCNWSTWDSKWTYSLTFFFLISCNICFLKTQCIQNSSRKRMFEMFLTTSPLEHYATELVLKLYSLFQKKWHKLFLLY